MSREPDASTTSLAASRITSASRTGSSSSKYRVGQPSSDIPSDPTPAPTASAGAVRLSAPNVMTLVSLMKRNSSARAKGGLLSPSSSHQPGTGPSKSIALPAEVEREYAAQQQTVNSAEVSEGKLPHKLRHHVSRLRSQRKLSTAGPSAPSPSTSPLSKQSNASPSPPRAAIGSRQSRNWKRTSVEGAGTSSPQYSRQSQKIQLLHDVMKMQAATVVASEVASQSRKSSASLVGEPETALFSFLDLLRPLQNSLSCATLMSEWPSEDAAADDAEGLQSGEAQSERGRSRMLRICCSLDNLLLSIGDRVTKERLDTEIVRGAATELVQLFQFAVKQVASAAFGGGNTGSQVPGGLSPQRWEKEAQYAAEFLEEVADRFGKLDAFVRSTLIGEVRGLQAQITGLEAQCEAAKRLNAQLQTELADLRDFHSQNGIESLTLHGSDQVGDADDDSLRLQLAMNTNQRENKNELEMLRAQCDEYARLLEMAKQEIRLSHHERDVHKANVAELSSALFKDSELATLRNQLQSEKKRVKVLEIENVALLECRHDQALKIQSLLMNKSPPTSTSPAVSGANHAARTSSTKASVGTSDAHPEVNSPADGVVHGVGSVVAAGIIIDTSALSCNLATADVVPMTGQANDEEPSSHWFSRLIVGLQRPFASTPDATQANKFCKMAAALPPFVWEQTQTRRQSNMPTISPSSLGLRSTPLDNPRPQAGAKKRKLKTGANDQAPSAAVTMEELEHSCRCLIWFFFQRFLMAQEADKLLGNPLASGGGDQTPLESVVYHFFLERASQDKDAIMDLSDFMQCLHLCRDESFEVELFCSYVDGRRTRDDLCFLLWVLQAIQDTDVGISYDEYSPPLTPYAQGGSSKPPRYLCMLKATFVTRAIFRLLRFKSTTSISTTTTPESRKLRPSSAPSRSASASKLVKPQSPPSPMRRKMKSRTGDELFSERSRSRLRLAEAEVSSQSVVDQATDALRNAIEANSGHPVTLDVFNQLLAQFAVDPSPEELVTLLGPFYVPTGDEKKLPWEVFISLLLEMHSHQSKWQREQLRSLFMHLHWQSDMDERAKAKKKAEELALLAAATKKRAAAPSNSSATPEDRKVKRSKPKKRLIAKPELESSGEPGAKFLRGLTRPLLTDLLRRSGIVDVVAHLDIDWLHVRILNFANSSAAEIHFDAVYNALRGLGLLPDWPSSIQTVRQVERFENYKLDELAPALQLQWREVASTSLVLCENDPNVFVRKQSQQWLQRIDSSLSRLAKLPVDIGGPTPWHVIENIRAMLAYIWRLASNRSRGSPQQATAFSTCLTEFYYADQAVRAAMDSFTGFTRPAAVASPPASEANAVTTGQPRGSLACYYNTSKMRLEPILTGFMATGVSNQQPQPTPDALQPLIQHVLQRYAVHLAYLFARYKTATTNYSRGVSLHQWRQMAYELALIHPSFLTPFRLHQLFLQVLTPVAVNDTRQQRPVSLQVDDLALNRTQFVELFVVVAFELYRRVKAKNRKRFLLRGGAGIPITKSEGPQIDSIWRSLLTEPSDSGEQGQGHHPAQILALFLHELVSRMAIRHLATSHEVDFAHKLCCPLIGRALLEHRAFLRSVFFYYAKQDEDAADLEAVAQLSATPRGDDNKLELKPSDSGQPADSGFQFQLEKTKRNSMSFDEFQMFLGEFSLIQSPNRQQSGRPQPSLGLEDAWRVFQSVMAVDNDDVAQLEFDEFAGAVVALAVFFSPDPFTLWHDKIHAFVGNLKSRIHEDDVRLQY